MSTISREGAQPGLAPLVKSLGGDLQELFRGELQLARAELDQKLHRVIIAAICLVGGALVGFAGLVTLLQSVAAALALVLPTWAALLIVGVAVIVGGGVIVRAGLAMLSLKALTPERTVASLQKNVRLLKEHT